MGKNDCPASQLVTPSSLPPSPSSGSQPHHKNGGISIGGLMMDDFPSVPILNLINEHALSLVERDRVAFLTNTATVGREGGREGG